MCKNATSIKNIRRKKIDRRKKQQVSSFQLAHKLFPTPTTLMAFYRSLILDFGLDAGYFWGLSSWQRNN
jgi:hypothetical protein